MPSLTGLSQNKSASPEIDFDPYRVRVIRNQISGGLFEFIYDIQEPKTLHEFINDPNEGRV